MLDFHEADFLQTCILLADPKVMKVIERSHGTSAGLIFNKLTSIKENVYRSDRYSDVHVDKSPLRNH